MIILSSIFSFIHNLPNSAPTPTLSTPLNIQTLKTIKNGKIYLAFNFLQQNLILRKQKLRSKPYHLPQAQQKPFNNSASIDAKSGSINRNGSRLFQLNRPRHNPIVPVHPSSRFQVHRRLETSENQNKSPARDKKTASNREL